MAGMRTAIVGRALWGIQHTAQIHYRETRPMPLAEYKAERLPLTTDCSGFVTCCYYAAGAPDPNGLGYTGQGYTGTLLDHLPVIALRDAQAGDLVVFGARPGLHVVMLLDAGTDRSPTVASHGTEAGPLRTTLAGERAYFAGQPMTVLRGLPQQLPATVRHHWEVRDHAGELLAVTRHPALWGARHPKVYRRHVQVIYTRRA